MSKVIFDSRRQHEKDGPFNPANICNNFGQAVFGLDAHPPKISVVT